MSDVIFNRTLPTDGQPRPPAGAPVSNQDSVVFSTPMPAQTPIAGNQEVRLVPGAPFEPDGDKVILDNKENPRSPEPQPVPAPVIVEAQRAPNPINTGTDVSFSPGGATINVNNDVTLGASADNTRSVRSEEVTFAGMHNLSVGSNETVMALSGDTTKLAGTEDVSMVPGEVLPSHEVKTGAVGAPITNEEETKLGARGKPRNSK